MNPLFSAIKSHDLPLLKTLLDSDKFSLASKSKSTRNSLLHEAVFAFKLSKSAHERRKNLKLGHFLIERGCPLDATNKDGLTPLHYACLLGITQWIYVLSYYAPERQIKLPVRLKTVINSMRNDSSKKTSYQNLEPGISEIIFDKSDLRYLLKSARMIRASQFKLFSSKHKNIVQELLESCDFLNSSLKIVVCRLNLDESSDLDVFHRSSCVNVYEILKILLTDDCYVEILIKQANPDESTIYYLVYLFDILQKPLADLTSFVETLLKRGLSVTSEDFEVIFQCFGCCGLFKKILHSYSEIKIKHEIESIMVYLYLHPNTADFDAFYRTHTEEALLLDSKFLDHFFSGAKIRRITQNTEISSIPSLLELSRNATRRHLISKFEITNLKNFYETLEKLAISNVYKKIIAYEKQIYF